MRLFWQPFDVVCCMEKRMLSLDAPAVEMTFDSNSLDTKGIFLICAAIHARKLQKRHEFVLILCLEWNKIALG